MVLGWDLELGFGVGVQGQDSRLGQSLGFRVRAGRQGLGLRLGIVA